MDDLKNRASKYGRWRSNNAINSFISSNSIFSHNSGKSQYSYSSEKAENAVFSQNARIALASDIATAVVGGLAALAITASYIGIANITQQRAVEFHKRVWASILNNPIYAQQYNDQNLPPQEVWNKEAKELTERERCCPNCNIM